MLGDLLLQATESQAHAEWQQVVIEHVMILCEVTRFLWCMCVKLRPQGKYGMTHRKSLRQPRTGRSCITPGIISKAGRI